MDYYQILEIDKNATPIEIRQKYLALSLKYHPDRNIHLDKKEYLESEEKFKNISKAFRVISDPIERSKYDILLKSKHKTYNVFYSYHNEDCNFTVSSVLVKFVSKIFSNENIQNGKDFINLFGKIPNLSNYEKLPDIIKNYNIFFNQKKLERNNIQPTEINNNQIIKRPIQKKQDMNIEKDMKDMKDIIYDINVSLSDIYNEVPKELNVSRTRICHHCMGQGYLGFEINMSLCHVCKGVMKILDTKIFPIDIREKQIIFKGDGNQDPDKEPSDLIININSKPDSRFKVINQYDLIYDQKVSLIEIYTEINVKLKHMDNKNYLFKYTSNNKILDIMMIRIRDLGLPINNSGRRGDLYIKLNIIFPILSKNEILYLENMKIFNKTEIDIDKNNYIEIEGELPKIENET